MKANLEKMFYKQIKESNKPVLTLLRHALIDMGTVLFAITVTLCWPALWYRKVFLDIATPSITYSLVILVFISIAILHKKIPYGIKAVSIFMLPMLFALFGFYNYGISSIGFLLIFFSALMVSVLFSITWSVISLILMSVAVCMIAFITTEGGASYSLDVSALNKSLPIWGTQIWIFFIICIVMLVGFGWILKALTVSIDCQNSFKNKLEKASRTDYLTGLPNRRCFYERASDAVARFKRYKDTCSIAYIDLDLFKSVNDKYGHDGGDEVLKAFSTFIVERIRDSDLLARLGGEEFVILMPKTDQNSAYTFVERLREKFAELQIDVAEGTGINITFSSGVSSIHDGDESIDDAIKRADSCLYKAKESGRNCTFVDG